MQTPIHISTSSIQLNLYIKPNSTLQGFHGIHQNRMILNIHATAKDNEANRAIVKYLANYFNISKTQVQMITGNKSRYKSVRLPLLPRIQQQIQILISNS